VPGIVASRGEASRGDRCLGYRAFALGTCPNDYCELTGGLSPLSHLYYFTINF
jgi:hypothetical protein